MSMIDPVTLALVKSAMDAGALRQIAHANNIANVNTPGYKPFSVAYEEGLSQVREAVLAGRASALRVEDVPVPELRADPLATGASSLDVEVAELSRNALNFQALTKALSRHYALLGMAISDGRR